MRQRGTRWSTFGWVLWVLLATGLLSNAALAQSLKVGVLAPSGPEGAGVARAVELFERNYPKMKVEVANDAAVFADAGVAAVVGHLGDASASMAAATAITKAGVPYISATSDKRRLAKVSGVAYTASYTKDVQAQRITAYAAAVLNAKRVALLHADDPDSQGVAREVQRKARAMGLEIVRRSDWKAADGPGDAFMGTLFPEVKRAPRSISRAFRLFGPRRPSDLAKKLAIDAFVIVGNAEAGASLVKQLREAELDVPVVGTDRWNEPTFITALGDDATDVYVPAGNTFEIETLKGKEWREAFGTEPAPTTSVLHAYEALELLAAAAKGGAADPNGVAAFLAEMRSADAAIEGLSSLLYFDQDGVMQREPWFLSVHRGQFRPAFTQIRKVVDPRELWRASQEKAEEAEKEETVQSAPPTRPARRRLFGRRTPAAALTAPAADAPAIVEFTPRRTVKVGGEAYHLTSVVYAGIDFYRVNSVDVGDQSFDVEFFLWFMWEGDVDIDNIGFLNQIYTEEGRWEVLREDLEGDTKYVCYKIKSRFLTPYDLRDFPFDDQTLPLQLSHETLDSNSLILVVDRDGLSFDPINEIYPEEWTYEGRVDYSAMYEPATTFGDPAFGGPASRSIFSVYQTEIHIQRILFPYLITLFMPLAIMILVSLFVEAIPPRQFEARLTLVMTALLSVVVFHLSQGDDLPNVGYLMRSDQFFMVSYVLLFVLIVKSVIVNMLVDRQKLSGRLVRAGELLFAAMFFPMVVLAYLALTLGNPFVRNGPEAPKVEETVEDEEQSETVEAATVQGATTEGVAVESTAPQDSNELYVVCNSKSVALGSVVSPILDKMAATEIQYTQDPSDELRDCSGNFLRVSSWLASACPEGQEYLAATTGVTDYRRGGDNTFKGEVKSWTEGEQNYVARTSRSTAQWYHQQGLLKPVFADSNSQGVTEASADLKRARAEIKPGTVLWFGKAGTRLTKAEGVERLFDRKYGEAINHVGVVHTVERNEAGELIGYTMYHGRRAYNSSDPEKQDNKITSHKWENTSRTPLPPLGNWTAPLVGYAPIIPPSGG